MSTASGSDAGLKTLAVRAEQFSQIVLAPRMRDRYAPIHVGHDVDMVRVIATPVDPEAGVTVNGDAAVGGRESEPVRLNPGRNILTVAVTSADGKTTRTFAPSVFRDYPTPSWRKVSDKNPWMPRDSAGELVFDGRMWLFGGYTPSTAKDVWCSADGVHWTSTGEIAASKRGIDIPLTFVFKNRMWVADLDGVLFSSDDGIDWTPVDNKAPWRGRWQAGAAVFDGRMWVMGGATQDGYLNDIWSSDDGVRWIQETADAPWSRRTVHNTPLVLDGKIWLIGGAVMGDYYPFRTYTDVWCSPDGRNWDKVTDDAPWVGRIWGSTAAYKDRLWLLGGFRSEPTWENLGDVWYSVDGRQWHQLEFPATCRHGGSGNMQVMVNNSIWAPRHEMSVYVLNERLWAVGGMVWPLENDVWSLEIPGLTFLTQPVVEDFAGTRYEYRARADFNRSRGRVRYRLVDSPSWLTVVPETGRVEGTAPVAGDMRVTLEAYDGAGETARQRYMLHILPTR